MKPDSPYKPAIAWLHDHAEPSVQHLLPAARLEGNEMLAGDLDGNSGDSLRITVKGPKTGFWKDFAAGQGGNNLGSLWKAARKIDRNDHATFFAQLTSFAGVDFGYVPKGSPINLQKCLADWSQADADKVVSWRGYTQEFVKSLHARGGICVRCGQIAFPVLGPGGTLAGLHYYDEKARKLKFSKGCKVYFLIFGDLTGPITEVHIHESRWDAYAQASVTGDYHKPGVRFIATLSAANGAMIKGLIPPGAKVYVWEQHDPSKNGQLPANERWFKKIAANAGVEILKVEIPIKHKDTNDWTRAGATAADLAVAIGSAEPYNNGSAPHGAPPQTANVPPSQPASTAFPPLDERPCYRLYDTAFQDNGKDYEAGVMLHDVFEKINRSTGEVISISLIDRWILSVTSVQAVTRTAEGKEHGYLLEFVPHGETQKRYEVISQSLLVGHIDHLMTFLRKIGISALYEHRDAIRDYLDKEHQKFSAKRPQDFWESVKTVGWHSKETFVLPKEKIGTQAGVWFQEEGERAHYAVSGTLEEWDKQVASHACGNRYLMFAICCGFAGPLLKWLSFKGVAFHFLGDSTSGKSTALLVGTSDWGDPEYMLSWLQTSNRLENQAASRCDTLLALDESHLMPPSALDTAIYMLLFGRAKGRQKRDSSAAYTSSWRVCVLSSGENSLEAHLSAADINPKAGQGVRFCDIPIEANDGVFDTLPEGMSTADFAAMLCQNAAKYYGSAGPAFVKELIAKMPELDLCAEHSRIVNSFDLKQLSAQHQRVWRSFAAVGLAGELAIRFKILSWKEGSAESVATDLFEIWRKAQPQTQKSKEHAQILERVLDFINAHADSRFSDINWGPVYHPQHGYVTNPQPLIRDRAGYWEQCGPSSPRIYLFTSGGLKEATKGFDFKRVLKALDEAGAFTTKKGSKGEKAVPHAIPGENREERFYHIDPDKLRI